jgi:predicted alpha/beta-fold hydrolase
VKAILQSKKFRDYEKQFLKQYGYEKSEDYYRDVKFDSKLDHIQVPTLFLNSSDDMFSPKRGYYIRIHIHQTE